MSIRAGLIAVLVIVVSYFSYKSWLANHYDEMLKTTTLIEKDEIDQSKLSERQLSELKKLPMEYQKEYTKAINQNKSAEVLLAKVRSDINYAIRDEEKFDALDDEANQILNELEEMQNMEGNSNEK